MNIPKFIFIIPYRDREAHKNMFSVMIKYILEDVDDKDYEIYYSHQQDGRPFNRGAMKNLGFLHIKNKYPEHYKDITFVFNDIDTMPGKKNLWDYNTSKGVVKHFYGFNFALGGIASITGEDFEKVNGFPNYWGWGFEDNLLNRRCLNNKLHIDRSKFYEYGNKMILQFNNTLVRKLDNTVSHKYREDNGKNGISQIANIKKHEELILNNSYMINFTNWDIPEKHTDVQFEKRTATRKIVQRKVNMMNIIGR